MERFLTHFHLFNCLQVWDESLQPREILRWKLDPFSTNSQVIECLWRWLLLYMKHIITSLFVRTNFIMPIISDVKSYTHWLPLVPNLQCHLGDILAQPAFTCFYRHSVKRSEYETQGHYFALYQSIDPTNLRNQWA